ncbi:MAG: chaperone modulator CbpM [Pseudohongiellaceae bacterium]|nr:chaperone modulator CbpM [Pseudohongiellaceae bacterium]
MQIDYSISIDLTSTCEATGLETTELIEIVSHGIIEPEGSCPEEWVFDIDMLATAKRAIRLQRDLHLDWAAVGLAIDLIQERDKLADENAILRAQLQRLMQE